MKVIAIFIMIVFCLTGCSEMKVIGNAAMRELRADAVGVKWDKTVEVKKTPTAQALALLQTTPARKQTFSSFRKDPTSTKTQKKGLWEQHGG